MILPSKMASGVIISFNIDLYKEFNEGHNFNGWIKHSIDNSLGHSYAIPKEYFKPKNVIPEGDQGYTEGYKNGYSGLKWL